MEGLEQKDVKAGVGVGRERGKKHGATRCVDEEATWKVDPSIPASLADATQIRDKLSSPAFPEFLTHKMVSHNKPHILK